MSDNKEIADKLRAQAAAEDAAGDATKARAAEDRALAGQLDAGSPPPPPPPPAPTGKFGLAEWEAFTGAHIGFRSVPEGVLASIPQGEFPAGSTGLLARDEGGSGARDELGIIPGMSVMALVSEDPRVDKYIMAQAQCSANFQIHFKDVTTLGPVEFLSHPHTSITASTTGDANVIRDPLEATSGITVDLQHQPHFLYVPYLMARAAGDTVKADWILEEMRYWVGFNFLKNPDHARGYERGIFNTRATINDERGAAWAALQLGQLVSVEKHDHPNFAGYVQSLEWNIAYLVGEFIDGTYDSSLHGPYATPTGRLKNVIGIATGSNTYDKGDGFVYIAAWQQHFLAQTWQFLHGLSERGNLPISDKAKADLKRLADFLPRLAIMLCGDGKDGRPDVRRAGHYEIAIAKTGADGFPDYFTTAAEIEAHANRGLPALTAADDLQYHDKPEAQGEISDGYYADMIPVLGFAVRDGVEGARPALDRLTATRTFQSTKGGISYAFGYAAPGVYFDDPPLPVDPPIPVDPPVGAWVFLGNEGEYKTVPSNSLVRYGVEGQYVEKTLSGLIPLGESTFGDPAPGVSKHADLFVVTVVTPPIDPAVIVGAWKYLGGEREAARVGPNTLVRYGVEGHYVTMTLSGDIGIGNNMGAGDPAPGLNKHADQWVVGALESDPPPPPPPPDLSVYDPTTEILTDTDDGRPSVHGSTFTQPYPFYYVHTLAHPPGGLPLPQKVVKPLPAGTGWREIPGTAFEPYMTPEQGAGGLSGVMSNWAGAAWVEALQMLLQEPGGGHFGNSNSTFYGFDADSLTPFEFYPPSPLVKDTGYDGRDKIPGPEFIEATHAYGTPTAFLDKRDNRWKIFTMVVFQPFIFDPIARTLERGAPYVEKLDGYGEQWTGARSCYDAKRGIILHHTTARCNQLSHYEPDRNRWFDHGDRKPWGQYGGMTAELGYYSHMRVDPVRDRIVSLGYYDGLSLLDLTRLSEKPIDLQPTKPASDFPEIFPPGGFGGEMSFDWDSKHNDFVVYAATGMWSMDPDTFKLTKIGEGGPVPEHNGCWGRFWYNAKRDEFQTFPTTKSNLFTFKR